MPETIRRPVPLDPGTPHEADAKLDAVYFARELPQWCGPDGLPRSWRHYAIGIVALSQLDERRKLATFDATLMAQAVDADSRRKWLDDVRRAAGLITV